MSMDEKNKKKQIVKISVFITSIFVIFLSVTYAFINLTLSGNKKQIITVGNLRLELEENENNFTITNALPMYDEVGLMQEKGFTFDLINEGDKKTGYVLKLEEIEKEGVEEENKLSESIVRYGLIKGKETKINYISDIKEKDYAIDEGEIKGKETISYELKLWIAHEVTDNTLIKDKSLSYRIKVEATQEITRAKFTVNFNSGEDGTTEEAIEVYEGLTYGNLPIPERDGYKFAGWYTEEQVEEQAGSLIESNTEVTLKGDQTLYARWEKIEPNPPELAKNMIPVVYEENKWKVANVNSGWYNYDSQEWANAVTVISTARGTYLDESGNVKTEAVGQEVPLTNMNTMWVWIPRYSYSIKSEDDGQNYYGKKEKGRVSAPSKELPGAIDIKFISKETKETGSAKYTKKIEDSWRTPDGFTFGDEDLSGIWVGKFELSHKTYSSSSSDSSNNLLNCTVDKEDCKSADGLEILPNKTSLRYNNIANFFYAIKSMQRPENPFGFDSNTVNTHMIKNSERGVTAYLSQSKYGKYGNKDYAEEEKQVKLNNCLNYVTGIGATTQDASKDSIVCDNSNNRYDGIYGKSASTTGNITGIYDMSGGAREYVMGVLADDNNRPRSGHDSSLNSGFNGTLENDTYSSGIDFPEAKYYDLYHGTDAFKACNDEICYGHALSEISGWYSDYASFVSPDSPWFIYDGAFYHAALAGVFYYDLSSGNANDYLSSRAVLFALEVS